jgi:hypothetical protein
MTLRDFNAFLPLIRSRSMKWILYALLASSLLAGALWAATAQAQTKAPVEQQEPGEFVPSEKVPADSAVSFPVDI